ncbi:MAG: hypothetical protein ACI81I_000131 [Arcobacteraceae bacterium]|jgi:hypothetical protein
MLIDAINHIRGDNSSVIVAQVGTYLKQQNASNIPKKFGGKTWGIILKKYPDRFKVYMKGSSSMYVEIL